jgi:hypothetical protein
MMTIQDDEGFEGVEFETPLGSFRAGREGRAWESDPEYRSVRKRVRRRIGFFRHVWMALVVLGLLLIVDLATGWDGWSLWVALIWGIVLALHFLNVFVFDSLLGREAERKMIERELRKRHSSGQ